MIPGPIMVALLQIMRVALIVSGFVMVGVILRYGVNRLEQGAVLGAVIANTGILIYLLLFEDTAMVRFMQDLCILLLYFALAREMIVIYRSMYGKGRKAGKSSCLSGE